MKSIEASVVARREAEGEEEELGKVVEQADLEVGDNGGDMIGEKEMLGTEFGDNAAAGL